MSDPIRSSFIRSVADLLRGDAKPSEYGKISLPFTVLRRNTLSADALRGIVSTTLLSNPPFGVE